jgi:16S rRNA (cytosine967-C5)-methyltransferase
VARPGTQALSFTVLRHLGRANALRQYLAPKNPPKKIDALLTCALALLDADPTYGEHTLVNQTVEAAKHMAPQSGGFINAVLRRFVRDRPILDGAIKDQAVALYNHPWWWIKKLEQDWPQDWQRLLAFNQNHPPMILRVNERRTSAAQYVVRLAEQGLQAALVGPSTPQAMVLHTPCPVDQLPGFAQGDVSVQDTAAQRAALMLIALDLPAHARVLDACAAPGGKTAHLLELTDWDILALDIDAQRLTRTQAALARLGLQAATQIADACQPSTWWDGQVFDAILLDAPCSGSGVVRRHPDIRWLRRPTDIAKLAATQARLLDALWPLLAPGASLLYCTCSVFKEEGADVIDAFLQRQKDANRVKYPTFEGYSLVWHDNGENAGSVGTGPASDGFFYALLKKHTPFY